MMALTNGWLRVGSKGGAFGVKKISSTMARMANRMIEQLDREGQILGACRDWETGWDDRESGV